MMQNNTSALANRKWVVPLVYIGFFVVMCLSYSLFNFHFLINKDTLFFQGIKLIIAQKSILKNIFPFWNSYEGGGVPLLFSGSNDLLTILLLKWFSVKNLIITIGFLYICLAMFFQFLFLKKIKCSDQAAFVGSIVWGFNSVFLSRTHELVDTLVCMLIPLGLLSIENILKQEKFELRWVYVFIIITAVQFTTGRWEWLQYSFLIYSIWIIIYYITREHIQLPKKIRSLFKWHIGLGIILLCAFLLTAFFSLHYVETIKETYRSSTWSPPAYRDWLVLLIGHLFPNLGKDWGMHYIPLAVIPFAIIGFSKKSRIQIFSTVISAVYVLFSFDFHLFHLVQKLPFQSGNIQVLRLVVLLYLVLSMITAVGLDRLFNREDRFKGKYTSCFKMPVIAIVICFFIVILAGMAFSHIDILNNFIFSGDGNFYQNIRAANYLSLPKFLYNYIPQGSSDIVLMLKFAMIVSVITYSLILFFTLKRKSGKKGRKIFIWSIAMYFVLILILGTARNGIPLPNLAHYGSVFVFIIFIIFIIKAIRNKKSFKFLITSGLSGYIIFFGSLFILYHNPEALDAENKFNAALNCNIIQKLVEISEKEIQPFRSINSRLFYWMNIFQAAGLETFHYWLALPPKDLYRYYNELIGDPAGIAPRKEILLSTFMRLANVKYIILTDAFYKKYSNELDDYELVYHDKDYEDGYFRSPRLYEDKKSFERFRFVDNVAVIDEEKTVEFMKEKESDYQFWKNSVVLNKNPDLKEKDGSSLSDKIELKKYKPDNILLKTKNDSSKMMVIANRFDKNWTAKIDGNPLEIYKSNYLFMGLKVPKGSHTIELQYKPRGKFNVGIFISIAFLLFMIISPIAFKGFQKR